MGRLEKLYEKVKRNPRQVRFDELRKLLLRAGFRERQPRGGSSHYTYVKDGKLITVPRDNPVKPEYVKEAIEALEGEVGGGSREKP
ncbi:MAG: type II toxin-antitoxin system HicA family toxin [Clostridia bacterium]|nr:type II toxin-antitoxin system HicA family toxin [Clostridia bacterium]